ncbi:MAG TPA: response regulator transcription factor [Vicinamibacterales bacterium]|nr:response regulator transcription factor [Vicinamibacterales bacterium]
MRIVVIEDDAVVAETLTLYLERAGFSVTAAADGVSGLALALGPEVSLVILDLMIPRIGGREVCRQIRLSSAVPVLMLTARASEDDRVAGLEIGADDYVAKPFSPREVVARVQALIRRTGSQPTAPPPIVIGDLQLDLWARRARLKNRVLTLTPTEFKLLEVLGRSPGRVFTREELLARAFGPGYDGLDRTVDVHITNLRRKLEPGRQPKYILTEHGIGYRLATADDF